MTDKALFLERLYRILDTVERCIPILGVHAGDQAGQGFKREKFMCETALLLYASFRGSDDEGMRRRCRELGAMLAPQLRGDEVIALMALRPSMIPELSVGHVCLGQIGLADAAFDATIARLLEFGHKPPERVSWKDLESAWLAARSDHFKPPDGLATSIARTALAVGFDCLTAKREELYAFTHGVIYFTDFGHRPLTPPRDLALILRDAEGALVRCMDDDDFDLAAELLMTWPFFGVPMSPIARFCLHVLMGVEEEAGFLPSLTLDLAKIGELDPEQGTRKLLDEAYHTIYVMGLLYAALLRGGQAAPETAAAPTVAPAPGMSLPARQRHGKQAAPQWEKYHAGLPPTERARLDGFVAGVALARALQANDLAGVRRIVLDCFDRGRGDAPGLENASEIVARLARLARPPPEVASGTTIPKRADSVLAARARE